MGYIRVQSAAARMLLVGYARNQGLLLEYNRNPSQRARYYMEASAVVIE